MGKRRETAKEAMSIRLDAAGRYAAEEMIPSGKRGMVPDPGRMRLIHQSERMEVKSSFPLYCAEADSLLCLFQEALDYLLLSLFFRKPECA